MPQPVPEPDRLQRLRGPRPALGRADSQRHQRRLDVLLPAQRGDQVEGLEDEPDGGGPDLGDLALPQVGQVLAVEVHDARGRPVQAAQDLQQRGLAVSGRALDGQPFAVLDDQVHPRERGHGGPALLIFLLNVGQLVHDFLSVHVLDSWSLGSWTPGHSLRASAAAGRSRAARQPPNDPAMKPPATASTTASTTAPIVTGAVRWTATVWVALAASRLKAPPPGGPPPPPGGPPKPPPPPKVRAPPGVAEPVVWPTDAHRGGASRETREAPANPSATPTAPPRMPIAMASPMTWPTIRLLRQPSALSVPNSLTRRETAAIVSRLASRNAATRTATASHLPRLLARLDALAREPVTSLARSLEVVTVAPGTTPEIDLDTLPMPAALAAAT